VKVVSESVLVPEPLTDGGEKLTVEMESKGSPLTLRPTVPVKRFSAPIVTV